MKPEALRGMSPLIMALDMDDLEQARSAASKVSESVDVVKIGLQLFTRYGPEAVTLLKSDGFEVFLDMKFIDIPNTVSSACLSVCALEPLMMTLHTMGGQEMMRSAAAEVRDHCSGRGVRQPALIGVTVLTSIDLLALKKIGVTYSVDEEVIRLAMLAADSGLDGLVASPLEVTPVRNAVGDDMVLITPGVRPAGASVDDQKRVATPSEALDGGADFIVVGRPLTKAEDPAEVANRILEEAGVDRRA